MSVQSRSQFTVLSTQEDLALLLQRIAAANVSIDGFVTLISCTDPCLNITKFAVGVDGSGSQIPWVILTANILKELKLKYEIGPVIRYDFAQAGVPGILSRVVTALYIERIELLTTYNGEVTTRFYQVPLDQLAKTIEIINNLIK